MEGKNEDDMFVDLMIETYINERSGMIIGFDLKQRMEQQYPQVARFAHVFAEHTDNELAIDCFALAIKIIEEKYGEPFCKKCTEKNLSDRLIDKYLHDHSHQNILINLIPAMEKKHPDIAKVADAFRVHIKDDISSEVFSVVVDIHEHVMRHEEEDFALEALDDLARAMELASGKAKPKK